MRKIAKIIIIILVILFVIILIDTAQAKILNNQPLIKIRYNRDGGNVDYVDKGILTYTYVFTNKEKVTVFRWEKYTPPKEENKTDDLPEENDIEGESNMNLNINVIIGGKTYKAELEENDTARNFINMLPQEYNMTELNGNEKYIYLDETLPTNSYSPKHIKKGDLMLYGNNCIVVFYKSFDTSYSYTKIGHIENLPDLGDKNINIKFEK